MASATTTIASGLVSMNLAALLAFGRARS